MHYAENSEFRFSRLRRHLKRAKFRSRGLDMKFKVEEYRRTYSILYFQFLQDRNFLKKKPLALWRALKCKLSASDMVLDIFVNDESFWRQAVFLIAFGVISLEMKIINKNVLVTVKVRNGYNAHYQQRIIFETNLG